MTHYDMKRGRQMRFLFGFIALAPSLLFAGALEKGVEFASENLEFRKFKGYDIAAFPRCGQTSTVGNPRLPRAALHVLMPPGATVTRVEVTSCESKQLPGTYDIFPAQLPIPISHIGTSHRFAPPNPAVYSSNTPYPERIVECTGTGTMSGYRIASLLVHPLQYIPSEGKLTLHENVRFILYYTIDKSVTKRMPRKKAELFAHAVRSLVVNPEDVDIFTPPVKPLDVRTDKYSSPLQNGDWDYVMVAATSANAQRLDPVREWKHKKGIRAKIVLYDFIYSSYSGANSLEKIKHFVADAETTWGASWFLMCGDVGDIPIKWLSTGGGLMGEAIPSDHYYADTDPITGTQPDYEDVWLSRASVHTARECSTFVRKTLQYEKDPNFGHTSTFAYFPSCSLWKGYQGASADTIAAITTTPPWLDSIRSDWDTPLSTAEIQQTFNSGIYFCHVSAHGGPDGWGHSQVHGKHGSSDADALTNFPSLFILNAICCNIGRLDYSSRDCYTEHMANNPNGGTVGIIGNSRYGWGMEEGFGEDVSEGYDAEFYRQICWHGAYRFAEAEGLARNTKIPVAQADDYCEYCMYNHVPLGDPEMPMWTKEPVLLQVTHQGEITPVPQDFLVGVSSAKGAPLPDARVCLMSDSVYERGYTNASGEVALPISPGLPCTMNVTVTAHNFIPYEGYTVVRESGVESHRDRTVAYQLAIHPTPCDRSLTIRYQLPIDGRVIIRIYDVTGRAIQTVISKHVHAGQHELSWDSGLLQTGVYFCRMETHDFTQARKFMTIDRR
jgi:hypothetical protein